MKRKKKKRSLLEKRRRNIAQWEHEKLMSINKSKPVIPDRIKDEAIAKEMEESIIRACSTAFGQYSTFLYREDIKEIK